MRGEKHAVREILQVVTHVAHDLQRAVDEDRLDAAALLDALTELREACERIVAVLDRLRSFRLRSLIR